MVKTKRTSLIKRIELELEKMLIGDYKKYSILFSLDLVKNYRYSLVVLDAGDDVKSVVNVVCKATGADKDAAKKMIKESTIFSNTLQYPLSERKEAFRLMKKLEAKGAKVRLEVGTSFPEDHLEIPKYFFDNFDFFHNPELYLAKLRKKELKAICDLLKAGVFQDLEYEVVLLDPGPNINDVIKIVKKYNPGSNKDVKELVNDAPAPVYLNRFSNPRIIEKLEESGAEVSINLHNHHYPRLLHETEDN